MYLGLPKYLPYAPPWEIPFEIRRSWLREADLRVAYIYEAADTSTFRYRVFNMVEALHAARDLGVSATWFNRSEYRADQSFVDACDVLIICRTRYDDGLARLVERGRSRGVRVVFDIDDFVIDPHFVHYIMEVLGVSTELESNWDYWYAYTGRLRAALDLCDATTATTVPLAEQLDRVTGRRCTEVIPNFLNRTQSEVSAQLLSQKRRTGSRRDRRLTIGFLSGSPTHRRDFDVAAPAVAAMMERFREVTLRVVGFWDPHPLLHPYQDRVEVIPLLDYLNLQRITAECELCLVPLSINDFSRCKSELKFFESAVVGCPIIASPTHAYESVISDGVNGWLAKSHEWADKLEAAIELALSDVDAYTELCDRALDLALQRYGWDTQGRRIVEVVGSVLSARGSAYPADVQSTGSRGGSA